MAEKQTSLQHLGIIMDGNRRWAKANGKTTIEGHRAGFKALKELLDTIQELQIEYVSVYAFSTENWNRSKTEVQALLGLVRWVFVHELEMFNKKNVRLKIAGSRDKIPKDISKFIENAENSTADNTGGTLIICFNYGGQQEIVDAVRSYTASGNDLSKLTIDDISAEMYVPEVPPLDLIIRSSGEKRLSNFMLWRSAYAELEFIENMWPDFKKEDLIEITQNFNERSRRFGV